MSNWKIESNVIKYTLTIPANSTVTIIIPKIGGRRVYLNKKH
ncbi:alpha-L-rhamnosidase C-terminal domain-containing protein [Mucilaginibacter sp. UR6-11]